MYIKYPHSLRRNAKMLALGAACLTGSFFFGLQSSGSVSPVSLIEAGGLRIAGDMDESGTLDIQDAIMVLEFTEGYATPTMEQRKADPTGDGMFTVDDALRILTSLSFR